MYSLNEVEVTAKRAARGAGYPWGIAEEAGKAVRWLEGNGLPGAKALLGLLSRTHGHDLGSLSPDGKAGLWTSEANVLCPLLAGAALSDHAHMFEKNQEIEFGPTLFPVIIVPFIASISKRTQMTFALSWQGASCNIGPDGFTVGPIDQDLHQEKVRSLHCCVTSPSRQIVTVRNRNEIAADTWSSLYELGHLTFAPDSEASRLSGAGGDGSDND